MLDNDLSEKLLNKEDEFAFDSLEFPQSLTQQDISLSEIDIETANITFETLKNEFLEPDCCIREIYKKYLNLCIREGLSIYIENKEFIEGKNITLYKGKKTYICKWCKVQCPPNKGQKYKEKSFSIKDLSKLTCECINDGFCYLDKENKGNEKVVQVLRTKSIFPHEVLKIYEKFYDESAENRENFLISEFEHCKNNQDLQMDAFINIFFDKVNQYFEVEKGIGISTIFNLGIKIFTQFKLYESKDKTDLKKRAFLTYFLMLLIKSNSSIFSIKRNILYEIVPSDFSFFIYVYKKKKIFENNEVKDNLSKCNLFLAEMFDYFFYDETHFNLGRENDSYDPVDFLIENCFFINDYFLSNSEKTKYHFLNLQEKSVNAHSAINANNIILIFDEFMRKGNSYKSLYINKDDYLSKELLEKEIRKKLEFNIDSCDLTVPTSRLSVFLIDFLNFESRFSDVNKEKVLRILSLYSRKKNKKKEKSPFRNLKKLSEIFDKISEKIKNIISKKETYHHYQDLSIIKKTLEDFQIIDYDFQDINQFNFFKLIQEIIDGMVLEKFATKLENVHRAILLPEDEKID